MSGDLGDELADLIVKDLNAATFSMRFEAVNPDNPYDESKIDPSKKDDRLKVVVTPETISTERLDRAGTVRATLGMNITLIRPCRDKTERKLMTGVREEIRRHIQRHTYGEWQWDEQPADITYDRAKWEDSTEYWGQMIISYWAPVYAS